MVVGAYVYSQTPEFTTLIAGWELAVAVDQPDAAYFDDAKGRVYYLVGDRVYSGRYGKELKETALADHFADLPTPFSYGHFDAAFYHPHSKQIYLFKGDRMLKV